MKELALPGGPCGISIPTGNLKMMCGGDENIAAEEFPRDAETMAVDFGLGLV